MAPNSTVISKLKVQLKLSITRLRMTQQKDAAIAKQQRRAMAQLLEAGKIESARIRVENIIRSDITTELHEILELYCELLLARSGLLEASNPANSSTNSSSAASSAQQCDPGLLEPIHALIYAAPRTDVRELHAVRALLVERFGKDFAASAAENRPGASTVPSRVLDRLKTDPPPPKLVESYLEEIARWYDVDWPRGRKDREAAAENEGAEGKQDGDEDDDDDEPGGGGQKVRATEEPLRADLTRATPPRDFGPKSPVTVAPPAGSTENVSPKVRVPGNEDGGKAKPAAKGSVDSAKLTSGMGGAAGAKPSAAGKSVVGGKIPDVDELAARFAALKK